MKKIIIFIFILFLLNCNKDQAKLKKQLDYDIEKICVEGHIYFIINHYNQGFMTIKLNDNGKPIKCENYHEKKI